MDSDRRHVISLAAYATAAILLLFFFVRPLWAWAMWNEAGGTLDLGFVRFTTRPPFPADARSVIVGLVLPIALAATGRILQMARRD